MSALVVDAGLVWLVVLLAACAVRVVHARSTVSRILALDTLALVLIGLLVLYSAAQDVSYFLDAALILAVLGFVATVAAARYYGQDRLF